MGSTCLILKKGEETDIFQLIHDVKLAAKNAGLEYYVWPQIRNSKDGGFHVFSNVGDTLEDIPDAHIWYMNLHSRDEWHVFDGLFNHERIIRAIFIEGFYGCERELLDFVYEYLKLNPEDYLSANSICFFTYEDIAKIKQKEFDPGWLGKGLRLDDKLNE